MLLISLLSGPCPWSGQLWSVAVAVTYLTLWLLRSLTGISVLYGCRRLSLLVSLPFLLVLFLLYIGLYVPVYSFGKFATYSMISVWTFGSVGHCLYLYLFFSLGCSVFYICRWILLQFCRFSGSELCYDGVLAD